MGKGRKVWITLFKGEPTTVHDTKKMAMACTPWEGNEDAWEFAQATITYSLPNKKSKRRGKA